MVGPLNQRRCRMTCPKPLGVDLDLIEGADLRFCSHCDQLTLHTVDQVLEVYGTGEISEVERRCLGCDRPRVELAHRQ